MVAVVARWYQGREWWWQRLLPWSPAGVDWPQSEYLFKREEIVVKSHEAR